MFTHTIFVNSKDSNLASNILEELGDDITGLTVVYGLNGGTSTKIIFSSSNRYERIQHEKTKEK